MISGTGFQNPQLGELAPELGIRLVRIDPMIEGSMGPGHYARQTLENVRRVAMQLNGAAMEP